MITFRTVMTDNGECPGCGQFLIPDDPIYRIGFSLRRRLVCGRCAWRRVMKYHPKYGDDGWPAIWAQSKRPEEQATATA